MRKLNFTESSLMPGVYYNMEREIEIATHVDDFIAVGPEETLLDFYQALKKEFELKCTIIGGDAHHARVGVYLGRTVTWTRFGIVWEPDPKHAARLIKGLGLEQCKASPTPHTREQDEDADAREVLNDRDARVHRGNVARIVYLAQDRMDLSVAACALATSMATPRVADQIRLKKTVRYLKGRPKYYQLYQWQGATTKIKIQTDSDWATCRETRRSKSGGLVYLGGHVIAHWCRLQPRVALSSGEAELYSGVRGISEGLGVVHMLRERRGEQWGEISHEVDASACRGILLRKGAGGLKHLSVKDLWVQDAIREHGIIVHKIPREFNSADALASTNSPGDLEKHLSRIGISWEFPE
jgi:hypothetical protein